MEEQVLNMLEGINGENDYRNSNDFVEEELLDSLDMFELIAKIEKKYCVEIPGKEIIPDNFRNVESIVILIKKFGGKE